MLAQGSAPRLVQDERHATWATKRTPADGRIAWTLPAAEIDRLIRAVGRPYPGAFTETNAERLTVWAARPWPESARHAAMPGQVVARNVGGFVVRLGAGGGIEINRKSGASGNCLSISCDTVGCRTH